MKFYVTTSVWLMWPVSGPYGGIGTVSERAPEAVLATSYCWWQRGSTPRWVFRGRQPLQRRWKVT